AGPVRRCRRPPCGDRRGLALTRAAARDVAAGRGGRAGGHALPARLPEDAGRAEARPAEPREEGLGAQLVHRALTWVLVLAPAHELRSVPDPVARDVVEAD